MDYGLKEPEIEPQIEKVEPLTTRTQVKKQLWGDENLCRPMKKALLELWDKELLYVYPNETVMLTEKGAELGRELEKDYNFKGGYSENILLLFKNFISEKFSKPPKRG